MARGDIPDDASSGGADLLHSSKLFGSPDGAGLLLSRGGRRLGRA